MAASRLAAAGDVVTELTDCVTVIDTEPEKRNFAIPDCQFASYQAQLQPGQRTFTLNNKQFSPAANIFCHHYQEINRNASNKFSMTFQCGSVMCKNVGSLLRIHKPKTFKGSVYSFFITSCVIHSS